MVYLWYANNELVLQHVFLSPGIPKVLQYNIYRKGIVLDGLDGFHTSNSISTNKT